MRFTIKLKLGIVFLLVIVLTSVMSFLSVSNLSSLNTALNGLVEGPAVNTRNAARMEIGILLALRSNKNAIISNQQQMVEQFVAKARDAYTTIEAPLKGLQAAENADVKKAATDFAGLYPRWKEQMEILNELALKNNPADNERAATLSVGEVAALTGKLIDLAEGVNSASELEMKKTAGDTDVLYANARMTMLTIAGVVLIFSILAAIWISFTISRGLNKANQAVRDVAEGDLTKMVQVSGNDEIAEMLGYVNVMIERLRGVVGDALSASENVSSGSQQLSSGSEQLSQGATEQASSAEEASLRWKKWPPTSSRTPITPPRRKRSPASRPRTPKPPARPSTRPSTPCARLPRRSRSSRKSHARPTFSPSTQLLKQRVPANMAAASRSSPRKSASWPNAASSPPPKSLVFRVKP